MGLLDLDTDAFGLLGGPRPGGLLDGDGGGDRLAAAGSGPRLDPNGPFARFFDQHHAPAAAIARRYGVDPALLLGLAALESGWGGSDQAKTLNNPFGAMRDAAGTAPMRFDSPAAAWQRWGEMFGPRVQGVGDDPAAFVERLGLDNRTLMGPTWGGDRRGAYNSVSNEWPDSVQSTIRAVQRRLPLWQSDQEPDR